MCNHYGTMLDYESLRSVLDSDESPADFAEELAFSDTLPMVDDPDGLSWSECAEIIETSGYDPIRRDTHGFSHPLNVARAAATVIQQELEH